MPNRHCNVLRTWRVSRRTPWVLRRRIGCRRASRPRWQWAPLPWACWWSQCWRCWPGRGREWPAGPCDLNRANCSFLRVKGIGLGGRKKYAPNLFTHLGNKYRRQGKFVDPAPYCVNNAAAGGDAASTYQLSSTSVRWLCSWFMNVNRECRHIRGDGRW